MDLLKTTLPLLLVLGGCIGVSPEQARQNAIGGYDDDDDGDPEHNPGKPCLACHDRDYSPGEDVFALAGTIYFEASDPDRRGLGGVDVFVRDAMGREMHAVTNGAGNFMFEVEGGDGSSVQEQGRGRTRLGFWPEYPLEVSIAQGGVEQRMETLIRREGSCATCHDGAPSATSVGRVYLMESP